MMSERILYFVVGVALFTPACFSQTMHLAIPEGNAKSITEQNWRTDDKLFIPLGPVAVINAYENALLQGSQPDLSKGLINADFAGWLSFMQKEGAITLIQGPDYA